MADYNPQVWRVNVKTQELKREPIPETWQRLGGRGLLTRIMLDEVDAKCDPLGVENKLIFAPGLAGGTHALVHRSESPSAASPR